MNERMKADQAYWDLMGLLEDGVDAALAQAVTFDTKDQRVSEAIRIVKQYQRVVVQLNHATDTIKMLLPK